MNRDSRLKPFWKPSKSDFESLPSLLNSLNVYKNSSLVPQTEWRKLDGAARFNLAARKFDKLGHIILRSANRDIEIAEALCDSSEAKRLGLFTQILVIQSHFDVIRHQTTAAVKVHIKKVPHIRKAQADFSDDERQAAIQKFSQEINRITSDDHGPIESMKKIVEKDIAPAAHKLFEQWEVSNRSLRDGFFYEAVSAEEIEAAVKAIVEADYGECLDHQMPQVLKIGAGGRFYRVCRWSSVLPTADDSVQMVIHILLAMYVISGIQMWADDSVAKRWSVSVSRHCMPMLTPRSRRIVQIAARR